MCLIRWSNCGDVGRVERKMRCTRFEDKVLLIGWGCLQLLLFCWGDVRERTFDGCEMISSHRKEIATTWNDDKNTLMRTVLWLANRNDKFIVGILMCARTKRVVEWCDC